jgi:uncharacterized protein with HEPN domain
VVERHIEIIGEAAARVWSRASCRLRDLSRAFRAAHPDIPWRRIIAQRNILAHEYGEIDDALVWRVAIVRLPELISLLERIVPPPPPEES